MDTCRFGVEIEMIVEPHTVRDPLKPEVYYRKLEAALRKRGLKALADTLTERYRKHPEHYNKWWITKDGSLGKPSHPGSKQASCGQPPFPGGTHISTSHLITATLSSCH
jgi:hypothetical protein